MTKIAVTGGSGKTGRAVVADLREHGHEVLNVDLGPSPESYHYPDGAPVPFLRADLTDYGQALEALAGGEALPGIEAVVHLAAIPAPHMAAPEHIFATNTLSTYNVFSAAWRLGLERVVWASSETTLGTPFDTPPDYAPVDEAHLRPETSYALSKDVGEELARQFSRRSAIPFLGLRFSNVMIRDDYARFPEWQDDAHARKWNLWAYVDESHVTQSVRGALAADVSGADSFIIAAADTVMRRPSRELMAEVYPDVAVADSVTGRDSLLDISHAREVLGYDPTFSWLDLDLPT
jgi:nucleoside-diphosphate-sugar epimerase